MLYGLSGVPLEAGTLAPATNTSTTNTSGGKVSAQDVAESVKFLSSLFPGHSNWWIMDNAYRTGDYNTAATMMLAFYSNPSYNTHPAQGAGFRGDLAVRERQLWIPIIYNATKNPQILAIWKDAVNQGLLPASELPSIFNTGLPGSTQTGMNIYVTVALVGAALYFLTRKKRA
jgi:hypothetical protein